MTSLPQEKGSLCCSIRSTKSDSNLKRENANLFLGESLSCIICLGDLNNVAMVKLLLDSGADVHAKRVYGKTAYNNLSKLKDKTARDKIKRLLDIAARKQQ